MNATKSNANDETNPFNCSITLLPGELQMLLNRANLDVSSPKGGAGQRPSTSIQVPNNEQPSTMNISKWKSSLLATDYESVCEQKSSVLAFNSNGFRNEKSDTLFPQFLEVLQGRTNDSEVFDTIQDLIHVCAGVLDISKKDHEQMGGTGSGGTGSIRRHSTYIPYLKAHKWLEDELKTWKLLYALFKDRILVQRGEQREMMDCESMITLGNSEKDIVTQLYTSNSTLREYQLIIDWLESCYEPPGQEPSIGHTTDRSVAWENTLFQLKRQREIPFGTGAEIVRSLDPDAPVREKRPLHALDEEDSVRLSRCIFEEVRQGNIDEAMALCKYCGQTWRAAILEGWRLYEDPNYEQTTATHNMTTAGNVGNRQQNPSNGQKLPIEGNARRDIWKKCSWMMADSKKFDEYTRAIAGAFCGHLDSLKSLLKSSWEDLLWAYLKVQVDIRVESEIRCSSLRSYHSLPDEYWNNKMTMEQIFEELLVHKDASVRDYAQGKIAIIQKYLILDSVTDLLDEMKEWIEKGLTTNMDDTVLIAPGNSETSLMTTVVADYHTTAPCTHLLRFLAHIVLFMRQIGRVEKEDVADFIIASYVEALIDLGEASLIAFYTAALPAKLQINLYSKFLETVQETNARSTALDEAINAGLDVENITKHTVETIRQRQLTTSSLSASSIPSSPPSSAWSGAAKATQPQHSSSRRNRSPDALMERMEKLSSTDDKQEQLRVGEISTFDSHKIKSLEWLIFLPSQRAELLWQANAMIRVFMAENKVECVQAIHDIVPQDSIAKIIGTYGSKENLPCWEDCSIKEYLSYKVYLTALDNFNEWTRLRHRRPKEPESLGTTANFTERMASEHKEQVYRGELNRWTISLEEQTKSKS